MSSCLQNPTCNRFSGKVVFSSKNVCRYCDDIFADFADISTMDAWLPPYLHDVKGTSLVVVRSNAGEDLINQAVAHGVLKLSRIDDESVCRSQAGAIQNKREVLSGLLACNRRHVGVRIQSSIKNLIVHFSRILQAYLGTHLAPWLWENGVTGWLLLFLSSCLPLRLARLFAHSLRKGLWKE